MSTPGSIFRPEALELHARGAPEPAATLRLGRPWLGWLFWAALVLFAAGVAALWFTRIEETATGPALVDGRSGSVTVLLPAAAAPGLARAEQLRVDLPGSPAGGAQVAVESGRMADEQLARQDGFGFATDGGILLTGRLRGGAAPGSVAEQGTLRTRAVLVLRSERLVDVFGRQLQAMLGQTEENR